MLTSTLAKSANAERRAPALLSAQTQADDLLRMRHVLEANVVRVNHLVMRFARVGLVNPDLIIGPRVLCRCYGGGSPDEVEVVVAGLCTERGLVAIFWDREDLSAFTVFDGEAMRWAAKARAVPVADCALSIRLLVSRQAQRLLTDLCRSVALFPSLSFEKCVCG